MVDVPIVLLDPEATLPRYARVGDAGADLVAREACTLAPGGGRGFVATGLSLALPEDCAGLVVPRSGLAANHGVTCLNTPGLIDSGYRGEIKVILLNTDPHEPYEVQVGDRIAQLVIVKVETARFLATDALPDSERSVGGFGHSGR